MKNALKFTEKGKIVVKAMLLERDLIEISVKDTGIGISEKNQNLLFKEFQIINNKVNKKLNPNGIGLGLYISNILA